MVACELPPRGTDTAVPVGAAPVRNSTAPLPNEEYVMVTTATTLPLYMNHDQAAFKRWGEKMGVKTSIIGPADWDVSAQIEAIEQMILQRPTGLLINGTDPGIATAINKAVDAGIPTVVYDSEIPGARPHSFLGSDWYAMGYKQGERVARLLGGQGKVACLGILGMSNQEAGFKGLQDALVKHPGIVFVGKYDDKGNAENAAKVAADLLAAHPDMGAMCGFTSVTGPGIALSVREAGKIGRVKITTVDCEAEHLALVREGVIQYLVGQKRELFTWYGAQFLWDMAHGTNPFSRDDRQARVAPLPLHVNTGIVEIDEQNVALFLQ
jgi:ribose transport system substrate-binding protein